MKLIIKTEKCDDGDYLARAEGLGLIGDGATVREALEELFNVILDVVDMVESDSPLGVETLESFTNEN